MRPSISLLAFVLAASCVPHRDLPPDQINQLTKLADVMDVQATVSDPQFSKRDQTTFSDADWAAFTDMGDRIQVTSLKIKQFSKGPRVRSARGSLAHRRAKSFCCGGRERRGEGGKHARRNEGDVQRVPFEIQMSTKRSQISRKTRWIRTTLGRRCARRCCVRCIVRGRRHAARASDVRRRLRRYLLRSRRRRHRTRRCSRRRTSARPRAPIHRYRFRTGQRHPRLRCRRRQRHGFRKRREHRCRRRFGHRTPEPTAAWATRAPSPSVNGCGSYDDFTDVAASRVVQGPLGSGPVQYTPNCMSIKVGQSVTFQEGDFSNHPLEPVGGDTPSPITETNIGTTVTFAFSSAGTYGFKCEFHTPRSCSAPSR